jgi:hypothetical protein
MALAWREQRPEPKTKKVKYWQDQTLNELWESSTRALKKRI